MVSGTYVRGSGEFEAGSISVGSNKVSRVNVIGVVVDRFENEDRSYVNIVIDDFYKHHKLRYK